MVRVCILVLWYSLTPLNIYGQNIVLNGDLEQYNSCTGTLNNLEEATYWTNPTLATSDYFNECAISTSGTDVPLNVLGFQYAHSGVGYAGFYTFASPYPGAPHLLREYIEASLIGPLIAGSCYYFEMYVNLANNSRHSSYDVGAYFSDTLINDMQQDSVLYFTPHIQNNSTNTFDSTNWTLVSGFYTAHGGEHYIILGNFNTDSLSHPILYNTLGNYGTYLYVDDVSLTVCTGLEEFNKLDIAVLPNPFTEKLTITANNNAAYELMLTDVTGRQIIKQNLQGNATIQTGYLNNGIYFATLLKKEKVVTVKLVKK